MARAERRILIDRPVEDVFAFVSEARNDPLWSKSTQSCVPDREPGVGQKRTSVATLFGRRMEGTGEVTEFEPGRKITVVTTSGSPIPIAASMTCLPVNGRTEVIAVVEAHPRGLLRLASPILGLMLGSMVDLALLKEVVESQQPAPGVHHLDDAPR